VRLHGRPPGSMRRGASPRHGAQRVSDGGQSTDESRLVLRVVHAEGAVPALSELVAGVDEDAVLAAQVSRDVEAAETEAGDVREDVRAATGQRHANTRGGAEGRDDEVAQLRVSERPL